MLSTRKSKSLSGPVVPVGHEASAILKIQETIIISKVIALANALVEQIAFRASTFG